MIRFETRLLYVDDVFIPIEEQGRERRGPRPHSVPHKTPRMTFKGPPGDPAPHPEGTNTGPTAGPSRDPLWTAQEQLPIGGSEGTCLLPWAVEPGVPGDPRERGEGDWSSGAQVKLNTAMTGGIVTGSTETVPASFQGLQPGTTVTTTAQNNVVQTPQPDPPRPFSALQLSRYRSTSLFTPGPSGSSSLRHTKSIKGTSVSGTLLENFTHSTSSSISSATSPWCSRTPLLARSASLRQASSLDALGYATLRRLQQQRIQPFLGRGEALTSLAKDVLFADAIAMTTGLPGARFTSQR